MKNIIAVCLIIVASVLSVSAKAEGGFKSGKTMEASMTISANNTVSIKWTAMDATDISSYVIEKSTDETNYIFVQNINAINEEGITSYRSMKISINKPTKFRIVITTKAGEVFYIYPLAA
jgi:hypothetical protein